MIKKIKLNSPLDTPTNLKTMPYACPHCGKPSSYNCKYDAYFCKSCDEWLEAKCGNQYCEFCASRPDKPSMV